MARFRPFVQDRPVPEPRPTAAPATWFALAAVALVVALLTMAAAALGVDRSEVATSAGGRITLDIPSGVAEDQSSSAPATGAAVPTPTAAPTSAPSATAPTATPTTATATPATVPPPTSTTPTTAPAVRTGGIYGQVVAADGTPLPGVCVRSDRQRTPGAVRTASDGTFLIDDVLPGPARVLLVDQDPGCPPLSTLGGVVARSVDVVAELWVPVLVTVTLPG
jgi:hypothetical protein